MRESRLVPPRLRPTMKIGDSVEDFVFFECVASRCSSDIKKVPQLLPRGSSYPRHNFGSLASVRLI
jgi:hypothetical protein